MHLAFTCNQLFTVTYGLKKMKTQEITKQLSFNTTYYCKLYLYLELFPKE